MRPAGGDRQPVDAGAQRLLHDDARALDVGGNDVARGGRPQPVIGGHVHEIAHAAEGRRNRGAIADVAFRHVNAAQMRARTRGTHKGADRMAGAAEDIGHGRADEAARARDENQAERRVVAGERFDIVA